MVKASEKLHRQMAARGWSEKLIEEARTRGEKHDALNLETGERATRYVHPVTGRSVVIDDTTNEVIHVGGDGFLY